MADTLLPPEVAEAAAAENIKGALRRLLEEHKEEMGGKYHGYSFAQGLERKLSEASGEKVTFASPIVDSGGEQIHVVFRTKDGEEKIMKIPL